MNKFLYYFIPCVLIASCYRNKTQKPNPFDMYINYEYISYRGNNSSQQLYFVIDSISNTWYYGKLIIDGKDSFLLHGFAKGSTYPSFYQSSADNKTIHIQIYCPGNSGQIRDSIIIQDHNRSYIIKERTTLYRQAR